MSLGSQLIPQIYASYRDDKLVISAILFNSEDGSIQPFSVDDSQFSLKENIMRELEKGSVLYICGFDGYIGSIIGEGPGCENQDVVVDYAVTNPFGLEELLTTLDNNIASASKTNDKKERVRVPYYWWHI